MKPLAKWIAAPVALVAASTALAQVPEYSAPRYQPQPSYNTGVAYQPRAAIPQQELDQILAPIALYPDALLSQVLAAATYPPQVIEAARWSRATGLQGDEAVQAAQREPWDASVRALVAFPELIASLADQPDWTRRLGDAFLADEGAVMQTVQELRRRADEAGNLRSSEQIVVDRSGPDYVIASPSPEVVYVPYYDPRVVYGDWWWPAYQPIWWSAWPGYSIYRSSAWGWGRPVHFHRAHWGGGFNWRGHYVRGWDGNRWRHDGRRWDGHRRGDGDRRWGNGNDRRGVGDGRWNNDGRRDVRANDGRPSYSGRERPQYNAQYRTAGTRTSLEGGRYSGNRVRPERTPQAVPGAAVAPSTQAYVPRQQAAPQVTQRRQEWQGQQGARGQQRQQAAAQSQYRQQFAPSTQAFVPKPARAEGGGNRGGGEGRGHGGGQGRGGRER